MIKCSSYTVEKRPNSQDETTIVEASLKADTSAEVSTMGATCDGVVGLEDGTVLSMGSTCLTADGNFGMLDSQGAWQF